MTSFLLVLLSLSICQPFCGAVGDSTLYFEVWRKVWRFPNESFANGSFHSKFYNCIGTPVAKNLILTSAKCLQRFSLMKDDVIYIYGNYNQTKTIENSESLPLIRFNTDLDPVGDTAMAFGVKDVIFDSESDVETDSALIVLSSEIFLNDDLQVVKIFNQENFRSLDYNSCVVSSRIRANSTDNLRVNCSVIVTSNFLNCKPLEGQKVPIAMISGSPVFCPINNTEDYFQIGFLSYSVRKRNFKTGKFFYTPNYISVADVTNLMNFVVPIESSTVKYHRVEKLGPAVKIPLGNLAKYILQRSLFDYQVVNKSGQSATINQQMVDFKPLNNRED